MLDRYQIYRTAEASLGEIYLRLESIWSKASPQLEFICSIWNKLAPDHRSLYKRLTTVLQNRLKAALNKIDSLTKRSKKVLAGLLKVKRWKYSWVKEALDGLIDDFGQWQQAFDHRGIC